LLVNLALETETAITQLPVADREYYRKQVAYRISYRKLTTPE